MASNDKLDNELGYAIHADDADLESIILRADRIGPEDAAEMVVHDWYANEAETSSMPSVATGR